MNLGDTMYKSLERVLGDTVIQGFLVVILIFIILDLIFIAKIHKISFKRNKREKVSQELEEYIGVNYKRYDTEYILKGKRYNYSVKI